MHRRGFIKTLGTVSAASLVAAPVSLAAQTREGAPPAGELSPSKRAGLRSDTMRVWQFWDLWHLDHRDNVTLRQGVAEWNRDATFVEPHIGTLSAWPTVYQDTASGGWRMLYSANWKPYSLMVAESDDGLHWQPAPLPGIAPDGKKLAPHHVFTLPGGSGGGVYLDPIAADGFPFKVFAHQQGEPVAQRAIRDPKHRWHAVAKAEGTKRYINEEFTLVSRDGLHWESRYDLSWASHDWHPEPPIFGFYNRHAREHSMTVRPGWGDRRQCLQSTRDFRDWSSPELLLQPDALDDELLELYGMPVFPCGEGYVGLLWMFHCESAEPTRAFNRFVGPLDCQLAFSSDGRRFTRGLREPFIATNEPGEHGCGAVQPSCLVELDDEIRIYSSASRVQHGQGREAERDGMRNVASLLVHTLRREGFMFLESTQDAGRIISKPMVLLQPQLQMNAAAPLGEVRYQLTDIESRPVEGFTFDECEPLMQSDSTGHSLMWKHHDLSEVVGKIVRLEVRLQQARLYSFRGHFHFIDAQDRSLIDDGKPIPT